MDLAQILQLAIPILGAGGLGGFFIGRRRKHIENKGLEAQNQSVEVQNVGENLEIYQKMIDDLEARFNKSLSDQRKYYKGKIELLTQDVSDLRTELEHCKENK